MKLQRLPGRRICAAVILAICVGCTTTTGVTRRPVAGEHFRDGTYRGSAQDGMIKVELEIDVVKSRIEEIRILKHRTLKGRIAGEKIPERIVTEQSTDVDAVTGATRSSTVIMMAAQIALDKAALP